MSTWKVIAERGTSSNVWVLEQPELGAISEVTRLDQVVDDMLEPIAYLSGEPVDQIVIEVDIVLPDDLREQLETLDAAKETHVKAQEALFYGLRHTAASVVDAGLSYRDAGYVLGVSHQRVAQLVGGKTG
ncbi:MAG: hypothetical protein LBJ43_00915 [Propionibacteriaceae bacterium]|nr:hypothetical protein [Propionibacteriaceae bacterium]